MLRRAMNGSLRHIGFAVAAAALALPAACSIGFTTSDNPAAADTTGFCDGSVCEYDGGTAEDSHSADAAAPALDGAGGAYQGSPLCNYAKPNGCNPDVPAQITDCSNVNVDAGADGGSALASYACHVELPTPQANVTQGCEPPGHGHDGDACQRGTDCAAGFECVGSGQCRHYCCSPSTCNDVSGKSSFCDIQVMASAPVPSTKVPVCMPVRSCKLFQPGICMQGETCSVVRSDGTTSCVAVGPAKAGESCDRDHCGENLVCLGTVGQRNCYQLCHTDAPQCPASQKCKGSAPMFPDPTIGICE